MSRVTAVSISSKGTVMHRGDKLRLFVDLTTASRNRLSRVLKDWKYSKVGAVWIIIR